MKRFLLFTFLVLIANIIFAQKSKFKGYEKSIELGYAQGIQSPRSNSLNIAFINGYRHNSAFSINFGLGLTFNNCIIINKARYSYKNYLLPVNMRAKINLTGNKPSFFLLFNLGYSFILHNDKYDDDVYGLNGMTGIGVDFPSNYYIQAGLFIQRRGYRYAYNFNSNYEMRYNETFFKSIDIRFGFKF
jgi:hypothetical protein